MSDEHPTTSPADPRGAAARVVTTLLPALLAAAAAFGAVRLGGAAHAAAPPPAAVSDAPGPTVMLDPFLVTLADAQRAHVIKLTMAIELKPSAKPDDFKAFVPRVRDAVLTYLRSLKFEEASNPARFDQMRTDLLEKLAKLGVHDADHILITEFVAQ